jgi:hypothetical protein
LRLRYKAIWLLGLGVLSFLLSACGISSGLPSPIPATAAATLTVPTEAVPSPDITASPTAAPVPDDRIVLFAPETVESALTEEVSAALQDFAAQSGILFEKSPSIDEIDDGMRLIVSLYPPINLNTLVTTAPKTQFIVYGGAELDPAENLALIGANGSQEEMAAFMAGYIAAVVTPDWRVGMIGISGKENSLPNSKAFKTGSIYFCGLCRQVYPPFYDSLGNYIRYPLYAAFPEGASQAEWQSAADFLLERSVKTVFLPAGANQDGLIDYLVEAGVHIIAGFSPPPGTKQNWIATVNVDPLPIIMESVRLALNGDVDPSYTPVITFEHANTELFSSGRQNLAKQVMEDLLAGYIDSGAENQE